MTMDNIGVRGNVLDEFDVLIDEGEIKPFSPPSLLSILLGKAKKRVRKIG